MAASRSFRPASTTRRSVGVFAAIGARPAPHANLIWAPARARDMHAASLRRVMDAEGARFLHAEFLAPGAALDELIDGLASTIAIPPTRTSTTRRYGRPHAGPSPTPATGRPVPFSKAPTVQATATASRRWWVRWWERDAVWRRYPGIGCATSSTQRKCWTWPARSRPSHHLEWRRGWDLNPRRILTLAGFQDRCNQPLCHLSGGRQFSKGRGHWGCGCGLGDRARCRCE
jgi:hypothetical protein